MFKKLKTKIWEWRGVLITAPTVTIFILLLRSSGLLQMLELVALDRLFLLRPQESQDSRIVIVEIDESVVQTLGKRRQWPISDAVLAQTLENLKQHQPSAIGLDLYRDVPIEPGYESLVKVLKTTPNLIGVQKVAQSIDSSAVAPPPELKRTDQVGANDLPIDSDGKIRRSLFYLADKNGNNVFSFAFKLACIYLGDRNITVGQTKDYRIKANNVIFPLFAGNDGGYIHAEDQGYQVILNYRGSIEKFPKISFMDILENRIPTNLLQGKIVLIGSTAESLKDLFYTPYSSSVVTAPSRMPGVVIHANAISQILSTAIDRRPLLQTWKEPQELLCIFSWSMFGAIWCWQQRYNSDRKRYPLAAIGILLGIGCLLGGSYLAFISGWWIPLVPPLLAVLASTVGVTAYMASTAGRIRKTFGRYLNDEVVANLLENPKGLNLGGERRKITILTSDLRGFTSICERLPAEEVITIINLYLRYMADVITEYQGTIDGFMGDGILVLFGAPTGREDDSTRAVACAVAMQLAMKPVNEKIKEIGQPPLEMGIGINTGEVVVGNIGSEKLTQYGVLGNQVNLTYRIESYTVGGQILISESTFNEIGDLIQILGERKVQPKGIKEPINIYDVGGIAGIHNLYLPQEEEIFFPLSPVISLEYAVLEGKNVDFNLRKGRLVKISKKGGEICLEPSENISLPKPLTNLRINLFLPNLPSANSEDVYAKVIEKQGEKDSFYIRFTNKPQEIDSELSQIYESINKIS